ncbi:MAG: hypothetical protein ACLVJH_01230 [Faecalibacterium prausnitzii]
MLLAETVLLAVPDALDVGTVHLDDHAAHDGSADGADHHVPGRQSRA